jgi:hypothetical protein
MHRLNAQYFSGFASAMCVPVLWIGPVHRQIKHAMLFFGTGIEAAEPPSKG